MKTAIVGLALSLLTGCVIAPIDGQYGPPPPVYDEAYGPPPLGLQRPPDVIVLPDTDDVYVVPDINVDLFFWNGAWWRPSGDRWYRSHYYDRGWMLYSGVPNFYYDVDPGWRQHYKNRNWYGHRWNYERVPNQRLQQNWEPWHESRHWERQRTWGVQGYKPRPPQQREQLRYQRQEQYHRETQKQQREGLQRQRDQREELQRQQRERDELQPQQRQREELKQRGRDQREALERQRREKEDLQRRQREELQKQRKEEQQRKKDHLKRQQQDKQELQRREKEEQQREKDRRPEGESHYYRGKPEGSDTESRR